MSDIDDALGEAELVEGLEKKRLSGKKLIIAVGGGVGVLILLIIIVSFLFGGSEEPEEKTVIDEMAEDTAERNKQAEAAKNVAPEELSLNFVDVDELLFNLNTGGQGESFLRMKIKLEVDRESYVVSVNEQMPRILDELNTFMRSVRPADLEGEEGISFIKEELLRRINQSIAPTRVSSILVEGFSIQG